MSKYFYRFRRIDNLIGSREELLKGCIYFSDPESLNDPMEGYREIVWGGDEIIWTNLFKHYFSCLSNNIENSLLYGNDFEIQIPVRNNIFDYVSIAHKEYKERIVSKFINDENIKLLISSLAKRQISISKSELHFYLSKIHHFAFSIVYGAYDKSYLGEDDARNDLHQFIKGEWYQLISNMRGEDDAKIKTLMQLKDTIKEQMDLIKLLNREVSLNDTVKYKIIISYPTDYLKALEGLMYPQWYTACFMTTCTNSSVWGNYGDNHRGVCLIYESEDNDGKSLIDLHTLNGYSSSGPTYGWGKYEFHKVDYIQGFEEINFFENIGNLPSFVLNSNWYRGENGSISSCAEVMHGDINSWRHNYWKKYYIDLMKKSKDWSYENEYRLILTGGINNYNNPLARNIEYNFKSLKGIIFGMKTSHEDKVKIIDIINNKCRDNDVSDFCFYQAYYSDAEKEILHTPLDLINKAININKK